MSLLVNIEAFPEEEDVVSAQVSAQVIELLNFCTTPKSREEVLDFIGISNHYKNYTKHILPLLEESLLEYTIKANPKDRNQKYVITQKGNSLVND